LLYASRPPHFEQKEPAMRTLILAALAAALPTALPTALSAATPSAAAAGGSSPATADARCLLTMAALTSTQDAKTAHSAQVGAIYFAGRVKAQEPGFDFTTRLKPIAAGLNAQTLQSELQRCAPQVETAMTQLDSAFKALSPPAAPAAKNAPAAKK
jgi:hypothetical protein